MYIDVEMLDKVKEQVQLRPISINSKRIFFFRSFLNTYYDATLHVANINKKEEIYMYRGIHYMSLSTCIFNAKKKIMYCNKQTKNTVVKKLVHSCLPALE